MRIPDILVKKQIYTRIIMRILFSWPEEPEGINRGVFLLMDLQDYYVDFTFWGIPITVCIS